MKLPLPLLLALAVLSLGPGPAQAARARRRPGNPQQAHPKPVPAPTTPITLHNWGYSYEFTVAKVVKPTSVDELAAVIRDTQAYPSPVRPLGNIHSVTEVVVSNGTVVDMRGLDAILGLATDERGRKTVTVQAGVTLIKLHSWLAEQEPRLELPFAPEIGDATVGSLTSSISKDSGVGDPALTGTLYKSIVGVKYLDHAGELVGLRDTLANDTELLARFKSSEGMLGVVTEVTLITQPAQLLSFTNRVVATADVLAAFRNGTYHVTPTTNYWLILRPGYSLVQERALAAADARESDPQTVALIVNATRAAFAKGVVSMPLTERGSRQKPIAWTTYKSSMVNHYGPVNKTTPKLDFTWFEYPIEGFEETVADYLAFCEDFAARNGGFQPTGAATYFLQRIPGKPWGWFSQAGKGFDHGGLSYTLDPIYHDPTDPIWHHFLVESVAFALRHGGRVAVTQTRFITPADFVRAPGNEPLEEAPNHRFTSPFLATFVNARAANATGDGNGTLAGPAEEGEAEATTKLAGAAH